MSYSCRIYGLSLLTNQPIPGVPHTDTTSIDLRVHFGERPESIISDSGPVTPWFTSEYHTESGYPLLSVSKLHSGGYFRFSYSDQTEFVVDQDGKNIWANWPATLTLEDTATYLLGPIMGFVLQLRGGISLHASAVVIKDRAVAFVGPAGAGKSTIAAAFAERGHRVLAEDVVTFDDHEDAFLVLPAYPCIRLWPASVKALYGSEASLPRLTPTWNKRYLDLKQERYRFSEEPVPLAAIYLLSERSHDPNAPYVSDVSSSQALLSLIANTYATLLMDKEMRARGFDRLSRVTKHVPIRMLTPHSDTAMIPELCATIVREFETSESQQSPDRTRAVS